MNPHSLLLCPICNAKFPAPNQNSGGTAFFMCPREECAHIRYVNGNLENMTFYQGSLCLAIECLDNQFSLWLGDREIALNSFDIFNMEHTIKLIKTLMVFE